VPTEILTWLDGTEATFLRTWRASLPVLITGDSQPNECGGRSGDSWISHSKSGYAVGDWLGITFNVQTAYIYSDDVVTNRARCGFGGAVESLFWGIDQDDAVTTADTGLNVPRIRPLTVSTDGEFVGEISVTLQRVAFAYFLDEDVRGADGSPTYGGAATDDILPRATGRQWWWRIKPGSTLAWSLTGEGLSGLSGSFVVTEEMSDAFGPVDMTYYAEAYAGAGAASNTVTSAWSKLVDGDDVFAGFPASYELPPVAPYQFTDRTYGFGSGAVATVSDFSTWCDVNASGYTAPPARARLWATYPIDYRFVANLRADADPHPGAVSWTVQTGTLTHSVAVGPGGAGDFQTRYGLCKAEDTTVGGASEHGKLRSWISSSALTAAGDDSRDWRCLWRGDSAPAMRIRQLSSLAVDGGSGASRSWTEEAPGNWEGYARLSVTLATDDTDAPVTITCGSNPAKTYRVAGSPTDGASVTRVVELCDPVSPGDADDATDTRYPVRADGLPHEDGPLQGIARILSLDASAPGGVTVTDYSLTAAVRTVTFLAGFLGWEQTQSDESVGSGSYPIIEAARGIVGRADARRSFIQPVALRQLYSDGMGGTFWVYSYPTITSTIADLIATPGIEADDSPYTPNPSNPYLSIGESGAAAYTGLGLWLGGNGCTYSGEDPTYWVDVDIHEYATIPMQDLADEYVVSPEVGNPFGSLDEPLLIRTAKFLRAPIDGAVYGKPGRDGPQDEKTVELRRVSDDTLRGDFETGPDGCYKTDLPYGVGNVDHYGMVVGRNGTVEVTLQNRRRQRIVFRLHPRGGKIVAYDVSPSMRHARVYLKDGVLWTGRASNTLAAWDDVELGIEGESVALALDKTSPRQEWVVLTETVGEIRFYASGTDGRTLTLAETIATGRTPDVYIGPNRLRYLYWIEDGAVKGQIRDASNTVRRATFTAVSGVDEEGVSVSASSVRGSKFRLVMLVSVGGTITQYTSLDGVAWS
jgi:hypothetical protein